ncbi:MAG: 2Fe-2S iron-sulfur cluster binding domain-containing protein [Zetaproteobacteria bacterium]|nr:2Fe-2S iron-sulfur cluster binding domain-containing protein [Zetaproteobacteria bacterium]
MPMITYQGQTYACASDETLLNSLEAQGVHLVSGCRGGNCQACLSKVIHGNPPADSQRGLKATERAQNKFLPCICKPTEDMEIATVDDVANYASRVLSKDWLNNSIVRIRLEKPEGFDYFPGQFINIIRQSDQLLRSYSLASIPDEPFLELHIKRYPDGAMSGWIADELQVGDTVTMSGALGDCFYVPVHQHQDLLLIGTGTGLAPLYGIVREALRAGHTGDIRLFNASLAAEGLYYLDELQTLMDSHSTLTVTPCVLHGEAPMNGIQGQVDEAVIKAMHGDCTAWRAYLCGDPAIVSALQTACFMAGVSSPDIFADAFTPSV